MITYNDNYIKNRQEIPLATYRCKIRDASSPYITPMHCHKDFEILFIDEGCAEVVVSGSRIQANQGSMLLINSFEAHSVESKSKNFAHRCICFDPEMLEGHGEIRFDGLRYHNYLPDAMELKPYFDLCYEGETHKTPGWAMRATGSLLVLFSLLTDCIDSRICIKNDQFTHKILNILEDQYSQPISSRTIAEVLNYNHSYFCRLFKKVFACSFSEYLNLFRIAKSKILLADHSISQTSLLTGYSSVSYFSSSFRSITGLTPTSYKKSIHN